MLKQIVIACSTAVLLAACAKPEGPPLRDVSTYNQPDRAPRTFGSLTYRAVEQLAAGAGATVAPGERVLVTTLVNVDDLEQSSSFGRIVAEQAASRLVQLGYVVPEIRLRSRFAIRESTGELGLSRDLRQIKPDITGRTTANAVVTGTYAVGGQQIYVNLRMIDLTTNAVISAVDYVTPRDKDTIDLLDIAHRR